MRTNEERIAAVHARAKDLDRERRARLVTILQTAGVAACFAMVILLGSVMPHLPGEIISGSVSSGMHASIFAGKSALGFIVIAIFAFLLGIVVTVFCFRLKEWQKRRDRET